THSQYRGEVVLGDIIIAVGGVKVQSYEDLRTEIEKFNVGSEIILTILRDKKIFNVPPQAHSYQLSFWLKAHSCNNILILLLS
ncbi:MAG: PDZ domain-containing protein, partial [Desulfocapsaceae bacterium]|nr:PDZ domain-containing protein [Desulfocapsaceae bacterium]